MAQFLRVGNRLINMDTITEIVPSSTGSRITVYFVDAESATGFEAGSDEYKMLADFIAITPSVADVVENRQAELAEREAEAEAEQGADMVAMQMSADIAQDFMGFLGSLGIHAFVKPEE